MFDVVTRWNRDCTGLSRRDVLRIGTLGFTGLTLADALRLEAAANSPTPNAQRPTPSAHSCIFLWLAGGPSHLETFDPKPDAPSEIRGQFSTIPAANGTRFGELLPLLAKQADQFSVIRSLTHSDNDHDHAQRQMQSGYRFDVGLAYPSYGSVVGRELGEKRAGLPPYMLFSGRGSGAEGPGYLGAAYQPFAIAGDPSNPGFTIRDVTPPGKVSADRLDRRRRMISALDEFQRTAEAKAPLAGTLEQFVGKAYGLITSPAAKRAFNLAEEKDALRDRYGRNILGQSCLLARRLIEAGVRFVTIPNGGWDTHENHFDQVKRDLQPRLDQAYSALLADLKDRALLDSTLVLCTGEFGRTPRVNPKAGRDHWPSVFSACIGGGGVKTGMVVGASDETASFPVERPVKVEDLAATIYHAVGVDAHKEYMTPQGRPAPIVYGGSAVSELF